MIKSATLTLTLTLTQTLHDDTLRTLPAINSRDLQDFPVLDDTRRHLQIGIVAPKVAGSSPVGHPPAFRIGEPDTLYQRGSQQQEYALLAPL